MAASPLKEPRRMFGSGCQASWSALGRSPCL